MLKITADLQADTLVLALEGSLSGPWVEEVEGVWEQMVNGQEVRDTMIDLSGVTFVSNEGKELLQRLFARGIRLTSSDVLTKSIIDAIPLTQRREKKSGG